MSTQNIFIEKASFEALHTESVLVSTLLDSNLTRKMRWRYQDYLAAIHRRMKELQGGRDGIQATDRNTAG